jgi:hypothetical protein
MVFSLLEWTGAIGGWSPQQGAFAIQNQINDYIWQLLFKNDHSGVGARLLTDPFMQFYPVIWGWDKPVWSLFQNIWPQ